MIIWLDRVTFLETRFLGGSGIREAIELKPAFRELFRNLVPSQWTWARIGGSHPLRATPPKSLYCFLFLLKKYRDSIDLYRFSPFDLQIMATKQACNVWRSTEFRSRLSEMPYNYQHRWRMYPAVFSFPSFIEFAHHISPLLVVSCNSLSNEIGPREPKYYCFQQTKGGPVQSRCFQVAYLLKMIYFGCPPTGDNMTWQCKV